MNSTTRSKVNRSKGVLEKRIGNCSDQLHFPNYHNLRVVSPNTSHGLKARTTVNQGEEWDILLWALLPLVFTPLPLALGSISCSRSYPKSFPGMICMPSQRPHNQFPAPHSALPEACPQLLIAKAGIDLIN